MLIELPLPALSPTMDEGTIAAWLVKKGDQIRPGQVIAEVQTDKAVNEWESMEGGYLAEIVLPAGSQAKVNMVTAILSSTPGEDASAAVAKAKAKNATLAGGTPAAAAPAAPGTAAVPAAPTPAPAPAPKPAEQIPVPAAGIAELHSARTAAVSTPSAPRLTPGRARISPVAARIATERHLDLSAITGTGPDGRIIKRDVEAAAAQGNGKPAASTKKEDANPFFRNGPATAQDLPLSAMRQVIGRLLSESKQQIPHFYVTECCDARQLVKLRARLNSIEGVKISVNDLIVKATALTLIRHPAVNATFHGNSIRRHGSADISIAVAIPDGLITPILRGAEAQTLSQINARTKDLAARATAGKLKAEEYQGGSFTISNLGMYGIESFSAIINPPQVAILAVGGIKDEPVICGGNVVAGKTLRVTLSADHRAVDGADAAAFLRDLRGLIENPAALML